MTFDASVFVGISLDGFIAREDGDFSWLLGAGEGLGDTGYAAFAATIDALVIGRNTYDVVAAFDEWPYTDKRVLVLSSTLTEVTEPLTSVHPSLQEAVAALEDERVRHVYVDGGQVIQEFLRAGLVTDLTISRAPILLGSGIPLFGPLDHDVWLDLVSVRDMGEGFVQSKYRVRQP